jgi:hypothetical protein
MATVGVKLMLRNRKNPKDLYSKVVARGDCEKKQVDSVTKRLISVREELRVTMHKLVARL